MFRVLGCLGFRALGSWGSGFRMSGRGLGS